MPSKALDITGGWKGVKLNRTATAVGANECLSGINYELDTPGALRSRDGFAKLTASAAASRYDRVASVASGTSTLSVGPSFAGTGADDNSIGTFTWSNPSRVTASDNSYATTSSLAGAGDTTHYLKATNFGFSVPSTATVQGVVVSIERKSSTGNSIWDASVRLVKGGSITGNDKRLSTWWPTTDTVQTYGGNSDLWGVSLTPSDVNASTFGVVLSVENAGAPGTPSVDAIQITIYYTAANTAYVLASSAGGVIDAINSDGSVATSVTTASDEAASYANFGSPSTAATYIAVGSGSVLRKYSGGSFSTVSGSPKCKYLAVQSPDNRLFCANISTLPTGSGAASASGDLIHISDAGDPETFSANNFLFVHPGDGESIQGLCAWSQYVLAFKNSSYYVFYGNSDDADGNPVFNYRPVFANAGLVAPLGLAPSPFGVFFLDRRGVYLTTGADPELISQDIDPLFIGGATSFWEYGVINSPYLSGASMCWHDHRLYLALPLGSSTVNSHTFVYDPDSKEWAPWDIPMGAMCSVGSTPSRLVFAYASGTNDLGQYGQNAYSDDAGTAISWHYRSGFYTVGNSPSQRVGIGRSKLVGTGSLTFSVSTDFGPVPPLLGGQPETVTLGTSPATFVGWHLSSQYGSQFSWQAEGSTAARLDSITHLVADPAPPGE